MKTTEYLAAVKAKRSLTSDYKLAKALNVPSSLVAKYQQGKVVPGPVVAFRIAEILGDQPAAVIADLEAERAEKMGKADDADYLRGVLRRIAGGAMSVLLAAGLGGFLSPDADLAHADGHLKPYTSYRRSKRPRRRPAQPFDGLMPA